MLAGLTAFTGAESFDSDDKESGYSSTTKPVQLIRLDLA
jgi:hypothetical protein